MPNLIDDFVNHGALIGRKNSDYLGGTLPYEVVVPDGDHTPWVPTNEPQSVPFVAGTDRFNCVTQAHHNTIENQMNRDIAMGRMPQTHKDFLTNHGYIDANGLVNFSERFSTLRNGTIPGVGNYLFTVAEDARQISGLIPQPMLPDVPSMPNTEYYNMNVITPEMIAMGQEFLKWFALPYEWVGTEISDLQFHLKQCSLQIVIPGHSIVEIRNQNTKMKINDSYDPYIKTKSQDSISDAMKVLVMYIIKQGVPMAEVINDAGTIKIELGLPGKKVSIGINSQKVFAWITASGEPIIDKASEGTQKLILEDGIIADED
jgi:hypothetical protein